jgi:Uma2 family endonuclease
MRLDDPFRPAPPPAQADLPFDDGEPMDSPRHRVQMQILIDSLEDAWQDRQDFYVGGNMFVYFSELQIKGHDFRGPDVFVVLDAERKDRRAWVAWEEGGRLPDVVIELTSESTAHVDHGEKKRIYAKVWRLPEYFIFDPHTSELEAYRLDPETRDYVLAQPDENGDYAVQVLGLRLGIRPGRFHLHEGLFLRWLGHDGKLLPTPQERADAERQRADAEQQRADAAESRLRKLLESD